MPKDNKGKSLCQGGRASSNCVPIGIHHLAVAVTHHRPVAIVRVMLSTIVRGVFPPISPRHAGMHRLGRLRHGILLERYDEQTNTRKSLCQGGVGNLLFRYLCGLHNTFRGVFGFNPSSVFVRFT